MKFGIKYNQRDIVLVPFPFSDLSETRKRPVLVLSKDKDNKNSDDLIICAITSNLKNKNNLVLIENENLSEGSLPVKSSVKVNKLFCVDKSVVLKKFAKLNKQTFDKIRKEFYSLI